MTFLVGDIMDVSPGVAGSMLMSVSPTWLTYLSKYDNMWLLKDEATCIGLQFLVNSYEQMSEMCDLFG